MHKIKIELIIIARTALQMKHLIIQLQELKQENGMKLQQLKQDSISKLQRLQNPPKIPELIGEHMFNIAPQLPRLRMENGLHIAPRQLPELIKLHGLHIATRQLPALYKENGLQIGPKHIPRLIHERQLKELPNKVLIVAGLNQLQQVEPKVEHCKHEKQLQTGIPNSPILQPLNGLQKAKQSIKEQKLPAEQHIPHKVPQFGRLHKDKIGGEHIGKHID